MINSKKTFAILVSVSLITILC